MTCVIEEDDEGEGFSWLSGSYNIHNINNEEGVISQRTAASPEIRASASAKTPGLP